MDTSDILSIFLRGALGARGRKRARRAANFLSGKRGFLTASTLLGAAGVAWGIYDSMQSSTGTAPAGVPGTPGPTGASTQPGAGLVVPPPIPGTAAAEADEAAVLPMDVLRLVRLAISAARADGTLAPAERALILGHARDAGIESTVEAELAAPHQLSAIVGGVTDAQQKQDLYVLGYTIVRADEAVSGAERIYLAQLAHQLGLDAATATRLEQDTGTRIDATPAEQASGDGPQAPGPRAPAI